MFNEIADRIAAARGDYLNLKLTALGYHPSVGYLEITEFCYELDGQLLDAPVVRAQCLNNESHTFAASEVLIYTPTTQS